MVTQQEILQVLQNIQDELMNSGTSKSVLMVHNLIADIAGKSPGLQTERKVIVYCNSSNLNGDAFQVFSDIKQAQTWIAEQINESDDGYSSYKLDGSDFDVYFAGPAKEVNVETRVTFT